VTAARLLNRYGPIEQFPPEALNDQQTLALLFKQLATLRIDAPLFKDVEQLRWRGATESFASIVEEISDARLATRVHDLERQP
jgi:hypothetical protein